MAGKTRVSEIFYMQASLFLFLVQESMSEGVFLQGCKRELNVLTALERTGVLCYTMERSQWHTLPRVLGAIFILVQSGDFSYSREQQAEDAAGLTLRAVYLLCIYWCCELSYSNGLFFSQLVLCTEKSELQRQGFVINSFCGNKASVSTALLYSQWGQACLGCYGHRHFHSSK